MPKRPIFRKPKAKAEAETPEKLFYALQGREKSHGYLRGPQQDVLRSYEKYANHSDLAFELPTGTGKTAVGLLVAEWRRRHTNGRVAYLTLTNQLANQVMEEAERLGIEYADLTGSREQRDRGEEGRFLNRQAVGVTTYSNLFNVNPVVDEPETLIFDDAHGGEHYVSDMWSARIRADDHPDEFNSALAAIRPMLTDAQFRRVTDPDSYRSVELGDLHLHPACIETLRSVLNGMDDPSVKYGWRMIRNHIDACLLLVSKSSLTLRPLTPPTYHHEHFSSASQRIYMSATLSGEGDLYRSYGITEVQVLRAEHAQWGRRYVFVPELVLTEAEARRLVTVVWEGLGVKRAVILTPSRYQLSLYLNSLVHNFSEEPTVLGAYDIGESVEAFTSLDNAILGMSGRYDGLDLPDDKCRFLIIAESPVAIGELEQHLRDHWKLGPVLRRRERTRLMQGMGRCTRNPTDFAVIFWLGQSLVNAATNPKLVQGMPEALRKEILWGNEQVHVDGDAIGELSSMVLGLLDDAEYRKLADESIDDMDPLAAVEDPSVFEEAGRDEVRFTRALWSEDYGGAYKVSRGVIDTIGQTDLTGYRAWWYYLASIAAQKLQDEDKLRDCLTRGRACGVNSGRFEVLLKQLGQTTTAHGDELDRRLAEQVWSLLDKWGWVGASFDAKVKEMRICLSDANHKKFHMGLDLLGQAVGADVTRRSGDGTPDVVWSLPGDVFIALEAKSEKTAESMLSKKDILQAKGHVDWIRSELGVQDVDATIIPVIVSDATKVHSAAKPHVESLRHRTMSDLRSLCENVVKALSDLRVKYSGKEFPGSSATFSVELKGYGISIKSIVQFFEERAL